MVGLAPRLPFIILSAKPLAATPMFPSKVVCALSMWRNPARHVFHLPFHGQMEGSGRAPTLPYLRNQPRCPRPSFRCSQAMGNAPISRRARHSQNLNGAL